MANRSKPSSSKKSSKNRSGKAKAANGAAEKPNRNAAATPSMINVHMFRLPVRTDIHPRSKNGRAAQMTEATIAPRIRLKAATKTLASICFQTNQKANVTKAATLDCGTEVRVPLFINTGDVIKIDTRDGSYVERMSKA